MIKEVDVGLWCASRLTKTLAIPGIAAGVFNKYVGPHIDSHRLIIVLVTIILVQLSSRSPSFSKEQSIRQR